MILGYVAILIIVQYDRFVILLIAQYELKIVLVCNNEKHCCICQ